MKYQSRFFVVSALALMMAACGSGGSESPAAVPAAPANPINVALPASGAVVTATYASGTMANFVTDGDVTTTTNFWSGNVADDAVTVDFGRTRTVTEMSVWTNDTSFNSGSPTKYIEISSDNAIWKKTAQISGGDVACSTLTVGSGKIRCVFTTAQSIRYARVRVVGTAPAAQQIVELQATGA